MLAAVLAPLAPLLATLWFLPAASAAGGFLVTLLFGGDLSRALIAGVTLAGAVLAVRLLGPKAALAVLAAGALVFAHRRGERQGAALQAQKMLTVPWTVRAERGMMLTAAMLTLSGCATTTGSGGTDVFCQSSQPLRWSVADSDETIRQAKAHNAVGKRLCGWRGGR